MTAAHIESREPEAELTRLRCSGLLNGARGKATLCAVVPADHAARGLQAESLIKRLYVWVAHQVDHVDPIELIEKLADQLRPDTLATMGRKNFQVRDVRRENPVREDRDVTRHLALSLGYGDDEMGAYGEQPMVRLRGRRRGPSRKEAAKVVRCHAVNIAVEAVRHSQDSRRLTPRADRKFNGPFYTLGHVR